MICVDLNNSITVHTTGQSGHAYNKHYDDMTDSVAEYSNTIPMLWDEKAVMSQS